MVEDCFLAGVRFGFVASATVAFFCDSVSMFIVFLLDRAAVVTIHHSG